MMRGKIHLFILLLSLSSLSCNAQNLTTMANNPDINTDNIPADQLEIATLGGGCFWCVEAIYQNIEGVYAVESGYSGGSAATANYKAVCSGATKHAEVAQVRFNPQVVSYNDILEIFFSTHDPTTLNRQGNDVGPQYRSVVFYHSEEQKKMAEKLKSDYAPKIWDKPIVTEIAPLENYFPAEDYHQNYYENVGNRNPYCTFVITPKVKKLQRLFGDKLKDKQ